MPKIAYIKIIFITLISIVIYWCWLQTNFDETNFPTQLTDNKNFKHYKNISKSGNIEEKLEIKVRWENNSTMLDFRLFSVLGKNTNSGMQKGTYEFEMIHENTAFDEVENISWFVDLISLGKEYYVYPRDIKFLWPKWKISNKDTESKIAQIENHRINIDKEIPFKTTSELIFAIQNALIDMEEIDFKHNTWFVDISYNYWDIAIDGTVYWNTGIFYWFSWQTVQFDKKRNKIHLFLSGQKSDTNLYLRLWKSRNSIKINFKWDVTYKNLSELSPEIKLDIKWKYIITNGWYIQVDLPTDYLNFTQTPLTKK